MSANGADTTLDGGINGGHSDSDLIIVQSDVGASQRKNAKETEVVNGPIPPRNIEVAIPDLPRAKRRSFRELHSDVIEEVLSETISRSGRKFYQVEFTDGRAQMVS
jgi:hypothetical protein